MSDMDAADPEAGQGHPQDGPPEAPRQDSTESPDQEDDASEADADETGGWSVCPIYGAVIADIDGHVAYHEWVVVDIVTQVVAELINQLEPPTDTDPQPTTTIEEIEEIA